MEKGTPFALLMGAIFTVVFGGIGLVFLVQYLNARKKAEISRSWPTTSGEILTSTMTSSTSTDSDGFTSTTYAPVIVYTYSVMGTPFHGRRVGFGLDVSGSQSGALKVITRYPVGHTFTVYYNPENPSEAVLEHSVVNSEPTILLFSVFLGIGVIAFLVSSWFILTGLLGSR